MVRLWRTEIMRNLKSLTREYYNLKQLAVQIKNQIHAKEHSYKPLKSGLKRLQQQLVLLEKQQDQIMDEIHELIEKDQDLKDRIDKIDKIEGVGFMTIVTIKNNLPVMLVMILSKTNLDLKPVKLLFPKKEINI